MANFQKIIAIFVCLIFVAGALYYLLQNKSVTEVIFPDPGIKQFAEKLIDKGKGIIDPLISPIVKRGERAVEGVFTKAKDKVDETFAEAKSDAVEAVKKTLNKKIDELTGNTEAETSPPSPAVSVSVGGKNVAEDDSFPLGFSVKKGQPAIFIIKNEGDADMSFSVDWGDLKKDSGNLSAKQSKTLFHIWENIGEYNIKVSTNTLKDEKAYSSYILVYQ